MDARASPLVLLLVVFTASGAQLLRGVNTLRAASGSSSHAGQECATSDGEIGICQNVSLCGSAVEEIRQNKKPTICWFDMKIPIVCCTDTRQPESKARKMCEEYSVGRKQKRSLLPQINESLINEDGPVINPNGFGIIGGTLTLPKTFPHMAAIGFGSISSIQWLCGGSLISERYVLTAAHCVSAGDRGLARWVLLGVLDLTKATSDNHALLFSVVERIRHPGYRLHSYYDDIALLKLDHDVRMDDYAKPACLQTSYDIQKQWATASGWGLVNWADEKGSNKLMDVELQLLSTNNCSMAFRSLVGTRKLMFGIQDDKMMCAGLTSGGKDTCKGDSGGPLQYRLDEPSGMISVVGVTSFGSTVCGARNSPAVYTRVSYYVPWIESIVWP